MRPRPYLKGDKLSARPTQTVERLMRVHGLSAGEAGLVRYVVPKRGTGLWNEREEIRMRLGNRCIGR